MAQLTRPTVTSAQASAIEAYRKASARERLFAVAHLGQHGLSERQATRAIALGYDIYNEGVTE